MEKMRSTVLEVIKREPWVNTDLGGTPLELCPKVMSEKAWKGSPKFLKDLQLPSPFPLFLLRIREDVSDQRLLTMSDNDCLVPSLLRYAESIWKDYDTAVRAQGKEPKDYNLSFNMTFFLRKLNLLFVFQNVLVPCRTRTGKPNNNKKKYKEHYACMYLREEP